MDAASLRRGDPVTPYAEPLKGERTGVTTQALIDRNGPIVARGINEHHQIVVMANGLSYHSMFCLGAWFPWSRSGANSPERLARHLGLTLEREL
jgi:hypothetical protein